MTKNNDVDSYDLMRFLLGLNEFAQERYNEGKPMMPKAESPTAEAVVKLIAANQNAEQMQSGTS